jgi:hypothetical protein
VAHKPHFYFDPHPDISAYELARMMNVLAQKHAEDFMLEVMQEWSPEMFRHFHHGEELKAKVELSRKEQEKLKK